MLRTAYAAGLRLGEVVRLKIGDSDSGRMVLDVRQGKGRKDRQAPLSAVLLEELRAYWRQYRPSVWLFPGTKTGAPRHAGNLQRAMQQACRACGLKKRAGPHTLPVVYEPARRGASRPAVPKIPLATAPLGVYPETQRTQRRGLALRIPIVPARGLRAAVQSNKNLS